ncbi:hypothetical protein C0991_012319 [Blastosporella zonata]|nr:hypothetical protein C0991_012319 [Blastosporella zonata]
MTFRWSWIFILYSLLVRLGSATVPVDNHIVNEVHRRAGFYEMTRSLLASNTDAPPAKPNVGAIVAGVFGGMGVLIVLGFCFLKRRRRIPDVEEGPKSPGVKERPEGGIPDLKSQFSPDDKNSGKFDRLREALGRRGGLGKKAPLDNILPVYNVNLPPGSTGSIDRPPPTVPNHIPRYPSVLERGSKRRFSPPPPLEGYPDLSRVSFADSIQSVNSAHEDRSGRRLKVPPKALAVPAPGRPLPGLVVASAKSAGIHMPKSPSRRRSFFSKHPFKHPFIPVRSVDATLRFPPGSPLGPGQYQPSRQHLEARMEARSPRIEGIMSPRSSSVSARHMPGKESASVRRQPPLQIEDPGSSKQARLVEALQSAGFEGPRTPGQNGSRTALPPHISRHPLRSAKFLPEPPTTSYI